VKNISAFDFSVDKEKNVIIVKRSFAAPLPKVWEAFTKPEILDQWWAPKPWKAKTKSMDFREGGKWRYAMMGPEGEAQWCLADYESIQVQKGFTLQDAFTDADGNINTEMPRTKWEVTFFDKGETTLVQFRLTYKSLADLESILEMGFKEGFGMALENLDEYFESK